MICANYATEGVSDRKLDGNEAVFCFRRERMKREFKWAVVGTGYITNRFVQGMRAVKNADLSAVVSRSRESGKGFSEKYGNPDVYTDYEEMLDKAGIDIVYLGIPNDRHYSYIMTALDRGIPVLSEKPLVDTVQQTREVFRKADEKGLFLMEGMWTRCFPAVRKVRQWIAEGKIGDPLSVNVSFDIKPDMEDWQPWKAELAHSGGSLRDVGIYSVAVANMVFPEVPKTVYSIHHSNGEVDDSCRLFMDYGDGKSAYAAGAFNQLGDTTARITGADGRISFGPEFWDPCYALLELNNGITEEFKDPFTETGFQYEIMAVQEALMKGSLECADFTHKESLTVAEIIEQARKEWGIHYSADNEMEKRETNQP